MYNSPFFSIIMPVYNAANWLQDSIDSIMSQSYHNWELICVNDGSQDESLAIMEQYASSDSRIKVLNQLNAGASVARNNGVEAAKGNYIMFLDSDDFFDSQALAILSEVVAKSNPDMIFMELREIMPSVHFTHSKEKAFAEVTQCSIENILKYATPYPTDKVYKTEILQSEKLRFNPLLTYTEDFHFWYRFAMASKKIVKTSNTLYNHRLTPNSLSSRFLARWQSCPSEELQQNLRLFWHLADTCNKIADESRSRIFRRELLLRATDFYIRTGKSLFKLKGSRRTEAIKTFSFPFRSLTKGLTAGDLYQAVQKAGQTIYNQIKASIRYHLGRSS